MRTRGYDEPLIEKLCFKNWLRVLGQTWGRRRKTFPVQTTVTRISLASPLAPDHALLHQSPQGRDRPRRASAKWGEQLGAITARRINPGLRATDLSGVERGWPFLVGCTGERFRLDRSS